ncbi:MAG: hypothetical protein JNL82_12520 [Myxococcales bacterium]|nr:hypothetical protein [Myxococcales bacterium]
MDLKTITATLALLGGTTVACGGDTAKKTETKTETKVETKTEVKTDAAKTTADAKTPATPDAKEVVPAAGDAKAAAGEHKCGEGKCGEGKCGADKKDGAAVPVDAAKTGDAPADAKAADPKKT